MTAAKKKKKSLAPITWIAGFILLVAAGWIWSRSTRPLREPSTEIRTPASVSSKAYAGSESCRDCHQEAFDRWTASHHQMAERPVSPVLDRSAFEPEQTFKHGTQTSSARLVNGRFQVVTLGPGGEKKAFDVQRVLGVDPLRQYLIAMPGGRWQSTEVAFDPKTNEWFDVYGNEDRQPGEWGHWTGRGMTWNAMCAACHNTWVLKNYLPASDRYATTMVEMGVGCEACHGPMREHVLWQRKYPDRAKADPHLHPLQREPLLSMCGSCHARRTDLTGLFQPGDHFLDHYNPVIPDETEVYYPDGQVHEEDYEYVSFLSSKMNGAGVTCLDCHDPHSGKNILTGNQLCMRCHTGQLQPPAPKIDPATHSHHPLDRPGGRCVDCHMPITVYMQRHPRRDHGFTIPDPLLTKQFGIPNACNRCHTDHDADWALEASEKWYGERLNRPTRARAQIVARARRGEREAVPALLELARKEPLPLWRASATILLRRWVADPQVTSHVVALLKDDAPLVRANAVRALEPLATPHGSPYRETLRPLLDDPSRAVRVEAAWALRSTVETNRPAGEELTRYLEFNSDQPSGQLQLGVFHLDRNDLSGAIACFRKAIAWDPNSAPLHHALAVALSMDGNSADAVQELRAACRLAPRDAEYRFKLGLAYNEVGRLEDARDALREAVRLDPQYSQAWYNLGLAYSAEGKDGQALEALTRAETLDPNSPQIPYARATILARLGRVDEARRAAGRALELAPGYADAAQLLRVLAK